MFNFGTKEKFLLLEVSPERINGLLISIDGGKKIRKEKSWEDLEKKSPSRMSSLFFKAAKTIVNCGPETALKIFIPLSMKRNDRLEPVGRVELENLLAQAVGKVFNHYRREASLVLGIDELDTVLADSSVSNFEIDGHEVISPLGFEPREISAVMEMVFIGRGTLERIKKIKFAGRKDDLFFAESGQAQADMLGRISSRKADFLEIRDDGTYFYSSSPDFRGRRRLNWSTGNFVSEICRHWAVNRNVGAGIYEYYAGEGVSPSLDKHLRRIFAAPSRELARMAKKLKTAPKIYFYGNVPLDLIGGNPFYELPSGGLPEKSGFTADPSDFGSAGEIFLRLAPFFEFYYDNSDSEINGWLKRRLNWLGSSI